MKRSLLLIVKLGFIIIISLNFVPVINSLSYSKSWSFERGDALKLEINPDFTTFQTGKNYTFSVALTSMAFTPDQTKFSNISVQLRFNLADTLIYSSILGPYEFSTLGSSITKQLSLAIPNGNSLNLTKKNSGSFEYKLNYNIELTSGKISYESTGWQIISIVDFVTPNNQINQFFILFVVIIILVSLAVVFRYRRRNTENDYSDNTNKTDNGELNNKLN